MELYFAALAGESSSLYPRQNDPSMLRHFASLNGVAWWQKNLTSWSLLTFEYFCSSSFSSRCKLQILANNSGCPSFILQMLTSLQGICVHFTLLWPDEWQTAHTFPCETFGKSSKAFCLPWMWFLALSTCNSSSLRFSESSQALRSNGLWKVSELWFEGVAIRFKTKIGCSLRWLLLRSCIHRSFNAAFTCCHI